MYLLLSLCIVLSASRALTESPPVPECSLTSDQRAKLNSLVVTSFHDSEGSGEYITLYTDKFAVEKDVHSCIRLVREVESENVIHAYIFIKGDGLGGENSMNITMTKMSTGVYSMDQENTIYGTSYILFAENGVWANYNCLFKTDEIKPVPKFAIVVRKEALVPPIADVVQASIAAARTKIEGAADVLGEIARFENPCQ